MKKRVFALLLLLACALVPTAAFAEGFGVYEWSAAGTAMGEAYMFAENDPAVIAYNPAQITALNGSYINLGVAWINPHTTARAYGIMGPLNAGRSNYLENCYDPAFVPSLFYATKAGKNSWWGIGVFPRFGNRIAWDADSIVRYDTIYSGIQSTTVQPTYAFKVNDKLSIAAGLDISYVKLRMTKKIPGAMLQPGLSDIFSDVEGSTTELGWLLSAKYDFTPKTSAAVTYRSRITHTMDADAKFGMNGMLLQATGAKGKVTLPDSLAIGIGHKFDDRTRIEFNAIWTNWKTYDALNIYFREPVLGVIPDSKSIKNWKAAWRLGLGLEHKINKKWSILCGYVFDQSPVPNDTMDFTVPTGDRHRGSIGFKYRPTENSELAFAYTAIWAGTRNAYSKAHGYDYQYCHIHDGLTQVLSLGLTLKLK